MKITSFSNKIKTYTTFLHFFLLVVLVLYLGKALFIPLGFSFLISILLYPICQSLEKKGFKRSSAAATPVIILVLLSSTLGYLLIAHVIKLSMTLDSIRPKLQVLFQNLTTFLVEKTDFSAAQQSDLLKSFTNSISSNFFESSGSAITSITGGLFYAIMTPIFSYLILIYRSKLINTVYHFFPAERHNSVFEIVHETIRTYYNFIKGMLLVYLIVGILNSAGLAIIGVPNPVLFGFIVSIFTFIPYVGIIISSLLPITAAWIAYDSILYPVAVVAWFAFVQLLEAYFIFPFIIGKQLKVNLLVMFMMIILGGMLWGMAGMILFIPVVSMLKIIASKSAKLTYVSDLLEE